MFEFFPEVLYDAKRLCGTKVSFVSLGISGQGSLEGFSTAPQSPDTQSRPDTPR